MSSTAKIDMKLEVVTIPVSDVDRATAFYASLGWRQDITPPGSGVVQFTPPASGCSVQFGADRTSATPGGAEGLYLIVSDVVAARESLLGAGVEVTDVFHLDADGPVAGPAPERQSYQSLVSFSDPDGNRWLLQEVTTRLPGRLDPGATSYGSANDLEGAMRRASEAHGEHEKRMGGEYDVNWPVWYAAYMVAEQRGTELPI
jgi:catechol 2,3-dioxygenase-like lactoylglutathione lyase family enzyme